MRIVLAVITLAAPFVVMGCGPSPIGRACDTSNPCPANYECAHAHDGVDRCMRACALDPMKTVCNDGSACLPLAPSGGGACYLGGDVDIGGACTSDLDCAHTEICVLTGMSAGCQLGCNLDGTHGCATGYFCQPTSAMAAGFCMHN